MLDGTFGTAGPDYSAPLLFFMVRPNAPMLDSTFRTMSCDCSAPFLQDESPVRIETVSVHFVERNCLTVVRLLVLRRSRWTTNACGHLRLQVEIEESR